MAQYDDTNYLTFIRTGVLNKTILDRALYQVHRGDHELWELRDALEDGLETAIKNEYKFLAHDFHTQYLDNVLSDLRARKGINIYGTIIPAEELAEAEKELELASV